MKNPDKKGAPDMLVVPNVSATAPLCVAHLPFAFSVSKNIWAWQAQKLKLFAPFQELSLSRL